MSMTSGGSKGPSAEINVTPLIDVLLVLLIIFMIIVPSAEDGLGVLIPQPPKSAHPVEENPAPIVVQVLGDGQHGVVYKINETVFRREEIGPQLAQIFANRADKVMFVKGDADLDFSTVADVIDSGHRAGVEHIGILTPRDSSL